jgi:hypothetical protein
VSVFVYRNDIAIDLQCKSPLDTFLTHIAYDLFIAGLQIVILQPIFWIEYIMVGAQFVMGFFFVNSTLKFGYVKIRKC